MFRAFIRLFGAIFFSILNNNNKAVSFIIGRQLNTLEKGWGKNGGREPKME